VITRHHRELAVAQQIRAAIPGVPDHHTHRIDDQARHDGRTHPSIVWPLVGGGEHLDGSRIERELEQLTRRVPPDTGPPPDARYDLLRCQACGDVAGVGTAHSIEYRVQPQAGLDDQHILVALSNVAAMGVAAT
jgi:hypothetical protein